MTGAETTPNPSLRRALAVIAASSRVRKSATVACGAGGVMVCIMEGVAARASRRLPISEHGLTPSTSPCSRQESSLDKAVDTPDLARARARRELEFREDINGLRALAVLGVVAFHADRELVPGGFAGVDVFFVISGFLITRIILSECAVRHFSLPMFYARRAKRILPALLLVLGAVWAIGWFRAAPTQFRDIGGSILGNSYFTVNF